MPPHAAGPWVRLGELLAQRRVEIDPRYKNRSLFADERGLNWRLLHDVERAKRANYAPDTVAALEVAYGLAPGAVGRALDGGELEVQPGVAEAAGAGYRRAGQAVAVRRGRLGMTQPELADAARVDVKTVSNLERGARWPIARTRASIAAALGWETDALNTIAAGGDLEPDRPATRVPQPPAAQSSPDNGDSGDFLSDEDKARARPAHDKAALRRDLWRGKYLAANPGTPEEDIPEPSGAELFDDTLGARVWDQRVGRYPADGLIWLVAALRAFAAGQHEQQPGTGTG
jgi:transcriptional regulator with XRE-family HTH domain